MKYRILDERGFRSVKSVWAANGSTAYLRKKAQPFWTLPRKTGSTTLTFLCLRHLPEIIWETH